MVDPRDLPEDAKQYHPMSSGYPPPEGEDPELPENDVLYVAVEGVSSDDFTNTEANRVRHQLGRFLVSTLGKEIEGVKVLGVVE